MNSLSLSSPPLSSLQLKTSSPLHLPPRSVRFRPPRAAAATATRTKPPYLGTHQMASCTSLYEILGIPMGATSQEIKTAYRSLARVCHPDTVAIERKDESAADFMRIHGAYTTLSDPQKRADYDRKMFRRRQPLTARACAGFSGYTRRNWETDQCW